MKPRRKTAARLATLRQMRAQGMSYSQMAAALGMKLSGVFATCQRYGITDSPPVVQPFPGIVALARRRQRAERVRRAEELKRFWGAA
jgi:hypothetical protein